MRLIRNYFTSFILLLLIIPSFSIAQLATSTALTPQQLVQNVLLGTGITATNITYTGSALARGTFNGTASNIGLSAGVILSSGKIINAVGPNNNTAITSVFNLPGDPDLNAITGATTYDASVLEFDFVPRSDTVKFRYIFASEEYMEFVNAPPLPAGYNDGFGFFISGPGISGPYSNSAQNIAVVPGTALPVTMYNLSLSNNSSYYFDNGDGLGTGTAPNGLTVQYDGFTVPLTAISPVQCGQNYHIKIAIADGVDHSTDSGVFLEEGSFSSVLNVAITPDSYVAGNPVAIDTMVYEGCGQAWLHFQRFGTPCNLAYADTAYYTITGTATNGVDYTTIGDSIIFPSTIDTASILLNIIPDALLEGNETITLTFNTANPPASITMLLVDSPPMVVNLDPDLTYSCPPGNLTINAAASGGTSDFPYQYTWTNASSSTNSATVLPLQTTTYYLTVTDICGKSATDSMHVTVTAYTPMTLTASPDTSICAGDAVTLRDTVTNGRGPYSYSWNPGNSSVDSINVAPSSTTTYIASVTDACGQTLSENVVVHSSVIDAIFNFHLITNQEIQFASYSLGADSLLWNFGDNSVDSISRLHNPSHSYANPGTYQVRLIATNSQGCKDTTYQMVTIIPDFYFYYPNAFTPDDNEKNNTFTGVGIGIKYYRMLIFNRFGELLYETEDINKGWDGTYNGNPAEGGVYVCVFELTSFTDNATKRIGNVTLIR